MNMAAQVKAAYVAIRFTPGRTFLNVTDDQKLACCALAALVLERNQSLCTRIANEDRQYVSYRYQPDVNDAARRLFRNDMAHEGMVNGFDGNDLNTDYRRLDRAFRVWYRIGRECAVAVGLK